MPAPTNNQHARRLLIGMVVASAIFVGLVIWPFWPALFLAAILAAAFRPWMEWLSRRFRGRRNLAAAILTLGVLLLVLVPVGAFGAVLVQQILDGVQWLREALASEGIWGLVGRLPGPIEDFARKAVAAIPDPERQIQQIAGSGGGQAAAAVGGVLAATGSALFQAVLMLIAFFFFLTDGKSLIDWLDARVPLRPGQFRTLIHDFKRTSVSVLTATVATAGIQTATALVGYLIARAPNLVFLTLATFVIALIPALGGAFVVVSVGGILLATDHPYAGTFLIVWGLAVVSIIDNVARPYLLKGGMALHGGIVFFALLGGLAAFGGIGLIIGPLAVTFFLTAVGMYRREFGGPGDLGFGPDAQAGKATEGPGAEAAPPGRPGSNDRPGRPLTPPA